LGFGLLTFFSFILFGGRSPIALNSSPVTEILFSKQVSWRHGVCHVPCKHAMPRDLTQG
jgi:hypothetical protein